MFRFVFVFKCFSPALSTKMHLRFFALDTRMFNLKNGWKCVFGCMLLSVLLQNTMQASCGYSSCGYGFEHIFPSVSRPVEEPLGPTEVSNVSKVNLRLQFTHSAVSVIFGSVQQLFFFSFFSSFAFGTKYWSWLVKKYPFPPSPVEVWPAER